MNPGHDSSPHEPAAIWIQRGQRRGTDGYDWKTRWARQPTVAAPELTVLCCGQRPRLPRPANLKNYVDRFDKGLKLTPRLTVAALRRFYSGNS